MQTQLSEVMPELFSRSEILIWNFAEITEHDRHKNIQRYMQQQTSAGLNPRDAFHRQEFNDQVLSHTGSRYLIGRYAEDRYDILRGSHIADEGRTYHLAMDIFSKNQEPVFAPCNARIVRRGYEPGLHNYGHYLILAPDDRQLPYFFFGHLASDMSKKTIVAAGEQIARLGSYENLENGGWSIHLHLQLLTELPEKSQTPIGYSSAEELERNMRRFPNPEQFFPKWHIRR